ncbi:MAG TPA: hypothetical protein VMW04_01565 [Patescibacteria group bacterium]|nr:hypothetical protein [Patescibacteria group bacterium]
MVEIDYLHNLTQPIFYVTNDVGQGIGLENLLPNYHIVCLDDHPLVDILQKNGVSVFCLERSVGKKNVLARVSGNILSQPAVLTFIKEKAGGRTPQILFFKPQKKIEVLAQEHHFNLLGNPVELNRRFEDKVAFFEFCQKVGIRTAPGEIAELAGLSFNEMARLYGEILVLQFGRGWAGSSTFFVRSPEELERLKKDYGSLRVKVGRFVKGRTFLNNAVIWDNQILISRPALQVKSHPLLTAATGGTGGRQWPVAGITKQESKIEAITRKVGRLMAKEGYRGFFGLDFLIDEENGEIFVSENNARLTASVPFYTKLELGVGVLPLLAYHLLAFLPFKAEIDEWEPPSVVGSEVVLRNTTSLPQKVRQSLPSGLYRLPLEFIKESYFLSTKNREELWLTVAAEGRQVNPEIELARFDTLEKVSDEKGALRKEYVQLAEKIRNEVKLEKC